jgi:hypothetical protein
MKHNIPYRPVELTPEICSAAQMLQTGECPDHLQKAFLDWVITKVCATYEQSYMGNPNDTIFMEGRRFCGNQIIKALQVSPTLLASADERIKNFQQRSKP